MFEARDPGFEHDVIEAACRRGRVDPDPIYEAMQIRAAQFGGEYGSEPMRIRIGVDWLREAADEAVDMANYLVWASRTNLEHLEPDTQGNLTLALMEVASAFNRVQLVRARLKGYEE